MTNVDELTLLKLQRCVAMPDGRVNPYWGRSYAELESLGLAARAEREWEEAHWRSRTTSVIPCDVCGAAAYVVSLVQGEELWLCKGCGLALTPKWPRPWWRRALTWLAPT